MTKGTGKKFWNGILGLLVLNLLALGLVACGDSSTPTTGAATTALSSTAVATTGTTTSASTVGDATGVTANEIVLGSFGPQTGPAASYGVVDRAIAAYFKKVNDEGGIAGRKIRFVYEDDGYDPARTSTVVKKLVEQDGVFALVGGLGTANNVTISDYLVQHGVPHIGPATGSSVMCCQPLKKNIFALQTNYRTEASILTRYGLDNLQAKKIAVFYQNDPFGKEGLDAIQGVLKERNLPAATAVSGEASGKDFSSQAQQLQQSGADTLLLWTTPGPTAAVLKEIAKLGWKPTILMSVTNNDPSLFKTAGAALDGAWTGAWLPDPNGSDPKAVAYREFMQKYMPGEPIGSFSMVGVAYGQLTEEALRRAGPNLTRESLIASLESFKDWNAGLPYKVNYSPTNRQGQNALFLYQAQNGQWVKKTDMLEYPAK